MGHNIILQMRCAHLASAAPPPDLFTDHVSCGPLEGFEFSCTTYYSKLHLKSLL